MNFFPYETLYRYFLPSREFDTGDSIIFIGTFTGDPDLSAESLSRELMNLGYIAIIRKNPEGYYEILVRRDVSTGESNYKVNLILFILTVLSTLFVGTLHAGKNPFSNLLNLVYGIPFSASLIAILGSHELGHYVLSRVHGVRSTLPYFIPVPHPLVGTLGAFIKIKSPIPSRRALLDIGAAGPLTGFIVAIPITLIGLKLSTVVSVSHAGGLYLGEPIILKILSFIAGIHVPQGKDLYLHPMAFAGWIGFFVTGLNLIPIGQLDGGHIAYALFGADHKKIAYASLFALAGLGFLWAGWWTWAILVMILGIRHPAPLNEVSRLDRKRVVIGIVSFIVFVLTFIPRPFFVK